MATAVPKPDAGWVANEFVKRYYEVCHAQLEPGWPMVQTLPKALRAVLSLFSCALTVAGVGKASKVPAPLLQGGEPVHSDLAQPWHA